MLPNDKAVHLCRLLKEEMKLPQNRCVVSASPLDHHRTMLYRELLNIPPGTFWKPSPAFVSLDELTSPYWDKYFEKKKKRSNKKSRKMKRKSSHPKKLLKTPQLLKTPKLLEAKKRKYSSDSEITKNETKIMDSESNEATLEKTKASKNAVGLEPKPSTSTSYAFYKGNDVSYNDMIDRWANSEFKSPEPSTNQK